ncbi:MAG: UvrD-helicase domain-containing protein, partial [Clostridia bacterium]|nr:UvrD-helicase domain-containing protein [Clostridia bacterium]
MPEFRPTDAQRLAIEDRGGALLVAAAAGSGKTRVLTERLMGYICDAAEPKSLESFLVITYTKAAAAELRGRIADELAARAAAEPSSRRLRRESALVSRAQIGTIHSFCSTVLREHSHLAGLSPNFAVADEERALALRRLALDRTLERAYESGGEGFLLLADTVGAGRDDRRLAELLLGLHDKLQSHARPEDWARAQLEALRAPREDAGDTPWGRELLDEAREEAAYRLSELEALLPLMSGCPKIEAAYGASVAATCDSLRAFLLATGEGW